MPVKRKQGISGAKATGAIRLGEFHRVCPESDFKWGREEIKMTPEEKGQQTWKQNIEKIAGLSDTLKDDRLANGIIALDNANAFKSRGDFDSARQAYWQAEECFRQANTLANGAFLEGLKYAHSCYLDFAINTDPVFKQCMTEVRDVIAKTPGILQSDIYTSLSVSKENAGYSLRFGDEAGLIKRTKKGRSYQLWNNP